MKGRVTRTIDIRVIIVYDTRPSPAGARGPIYSLTTTRRVRSPAITTPRSCPLLDTMSISGRIEYGLVLPLLPHLDLGDLLSWQPDLDLSSPYPCLEIGLCFRRRAMDDRSEEHTSELQSRGHLVCRLLLEKKNNTIRL